MIQVAESQKILLLYFYLVKNSQGNCSFGKRFPAFGLKIDNGQRIHAFVLKIPSEI